MYSSPFGQAELRLFRNEAGALAVRVTSSNENTTRVLGAMNAALAAGVRMASTCLITGASALIGFLFVLVLKVSPSLVMGCWISLLFVVSGWSVVRAQRARAEFEVEATAALRAAHVEEEEKS